ncbi:PEP-CTERM sorting domain-containing protein [Nitrosococcus halophilus]|uniref:PEP-CTERM sorting domain-containing protein n=1 Tax=Nitrosococcus halophilus TaxID=133539 RepID=UPI0012FEC565|nr:PEP-CTERM sorting domain-containing protein [Nitrosococcus halophilus]
MSDSETFPNISHLYDQGEAIGFVRHTQGRFFGRLEKGISVIADAPGEEKRAELFVAAHWTHPGGLLKQVISIDGRLEMTLDSQRLGPPAGMWAEAGADWFGRLDPLGFEIEDATALVRSGSFDIQDSKEESGFRPANTRVDFRNVLRVGALLGPNAGAGDFAIASLFDSSLEESRAIPEPPTIVLFFLGLGVALCFSKKAPSAAKFKPNQTGQI